MKFKVGDRVFWKEDREIRGRVCHLLSADNMVGVDLGRSRGSNNCQGHCADRCGHYFNAKELELVMRKKLKPEELIL